METFPQIITVDDQEKGLIAAKDFLYKKVNDQTLLFLSGGSTPRDLYQSLAKERRIKPKTAGMIDERIDRSNFEMIKSTGLLEYFGNLGVKFHQMISAFDYNNLIQKLFETAKNKVAIMGIGEDGHTAGIPARTQNSKLKTQNYVVSIKNFPGEFHERITLTLKALSEMDLLIILAFGEKKKEALRKMFEKGPIEEIPARFYTKPEIAKKTILITDQKI